MFILDNESCSYAEAKFCQALEKTQLKWEFSARLEDLKCQAKELGYSSVSSGKLLRVTIQKNHLMGPKFKHIHLTTICPVALEFGQKAGGSISQTGGRRQQEGRLQDIV